MCLFVCVPLYISYHYHFHSPLLLPDITLIRQRYFMPRPFSCKADNWAQRERASRLLSQASDSRHLLLTCACYFDFESVQHLFSLNLYKTKLNSLMLIALSLKLSTETKAVRQYVRLMYCQTVHAEVFNLYSQCIRKRRKEKRDA